MIIIKEYSQLDIFKYEDFVFSNSNGNFFQSYKAYEFFEQIKYYKPLIYVVEDNNQFKASLLAVLIKEKGIKSYFSRRCIVWGGPILKKGNEELVNIILKEIIMDISQKAVYIEFRNFFDAANIKDYFIDNSFHYYEHLNYIVRTLDIDIVKSKISKSKKRQIKQSIINGAEIIEAENENQLKDFYNILSRLYYYKIRKPLPNYSFFRTFYDKKELGKYFLVKHKNKIIGGIMCPIDKYAIYEWFIGGLDGEIKNVYPSILATWAPIEYAAKNGLKYFNFMGAGRPDEDYGVREFKSKFGGELVEYGRFIRVFNPFLLNLGKIYIKHRFSRQ